MKIDREKFLLDRKKGIGGSDVAGILGTSPYITPLQLYFDKTTPELDYEDVSEDQERGNIAEKYILEMYEHKNNVTLERFASPIIHKEYSFMRGNVDAIVKDRNIVVEAKTTRMSPIAWEAGEIPEYYKSQIAFYAMVTDAERVDLAVLFPHWEYRCFTYERDLKYEQMIIEKVVHFWNEHIMKGIPPEPSSLQEVYDSFILTPGKVATADEEMNKTLAELDEINIKTTDLKKRKALLQMNIASYMKDANVLEGEDYKMTLTEYDVSRFDSTLFKEENPELYAKFLKKSKNKRLTMKGI